MKLELIDLKSRNNKVLILLFLICALAFTLRLPGVFWGVHFSGHPKFTEYNGSETILVWMAREFTDHYTNEEDYYPKGFAFQMALVASALKPFMTLDNPQLTLIGRFLSVVYGTLAVALLFFLVRELTGKEEMAFISALFFSLVQPHINYSHAAVTDAGLLFWVYALIYSAFLYLRTKKKRYFVLVLISAGISLSFKLAFIAVIPVVYIVIRNRWDWKKAVGMAVLLFAIFFLANGGRYTLSNFLFTLNNVAGDNLFARKYNKLLNLLCYPIILFMALGLPSLVLILRGTFQGISRLIKRDSVFSRDILFILVLPLVLQFISVCFISYADERHIMLLFPLLCAVAAYGFMSLKNWALFSTKTRRALMLGCIVVYQLIFLGSITYYNIFDSRESATYWIKKNIPIGEKVALPLYSEMPLLEKDYKIVPLKDATYVVLSSGYYTRYLRTISNPFEKYPTWDTVFHPDREGFKFCQGLFKGQLPYKLIKRFHGSIDSPETIILNKVFGSFTGYDDVLIYKKDEYSSQPFTPAPNPQLVPSASATL